MSARTPTEAVKDLCLSFGDTEHSRSHGLPDFRVGGRVFAQYAVNHHGDGRVALWLNAPEGAQEVFVDQDPASYFVPPYTGPKGWLGVNLDKNLPWDEVQFQVTEAYLHTSGREDDVESVMPDVPPPDSPIDPVEFDPFNAPDCQQRLEEIRAQCLALPETIEVKQFGNPAFKAGKKTFAWAYVVNGTPSVEVRVGKDRQAALIEDSRFTIPRYTGHNGWIQLALVGEDCMERFRELMLESYKHFALKRMLKALEESEPS